MLAQCLGKIKNSVITNKILIIKIKLYSERGYYHFHNLIYDLSDKLHSQSLLLKNRCDTFIFFFYKILSSKIDC